MTDRDAFIRATVEAPSDDAPRFVFMDWLDETEGMEVAALHWRWYWFDLIPRLRRLPALLKDRDPRLDRPNPAYTPTILAQKIKPAALRALWGLAVVRTFVDQGGDPVWGRVGKDLQFFTAACETVLITHSPPVPRLHIEATFENYYNDILVTKVNIEPPMEVKAGLPNTLINYFAAPSWAAYSAVSMPWDLTRFMNHLRDCLRSWDETFLLGPSHVGPMGSEWKYETHQLYPGFITESLKIFLAGYEKVKKARHALEIA